MGRSIRQEAERSYLLHCGDVFRDIFRVDKWPWGHWLDGVCTSINFMSAVLCLIAFPIMVPVAAFYRKKEAIELLDRLERGSEIRKKRLFSRVQKLKQPAASAGSLPAEFERELGKLVDTYVRRGLPKPDLVAKMRWMTGNCEMS